MDWSIVISRQKAALLGVVERMRAIAGGVPTLAILRILRPAESACRRLIVIVAAGLVLKTNAGKAEGRPLPDFSSFAKSRGARPPTFRLFDPPWSLEPRAFRAGRKPVPKVRSFGADGFRTPLCPAGHLPHKGGDQPNSAAAANGPRERDIFSGPDAFESSAPDGRPSQSPPLWGRCPAGQRGVYNAAEPASPLHRRIAALHHALNTLPAQARRLNRIMAARERAVAEKAAQGLTPGSPKNPLPLGPIRPGRPPGHIARPRNEADLILKDCQDLALYRTRVPP